MAKGKYTPEIVGDILFAIAKTGRDGDGIKAGGISQFTFYVWIKKHSEFADQVNHAKRTWRYKLFRDDPQIVEKAMRRLDEALDPITEKWDSTKSEPKVTYELNPDYPDVSIEEQMLTGLARKVVKMVPTEINVRQVVRPASPWAIKMVLGPDYASNGPGSQSDSDDDSIETVDFDFEDVDAP